MIILIDNNNKQQFVGNLLIKILCRKDVAPIIVLCYSTTNAINANGIHCKLLSPLLADVIQIKLRINHSLIFIIISI